MLRSRLLSVFLAGLMVIPGCSPQSSFQSPPPPNVSVVQPIVETVPIYLEENGQTEAVEQAVVQARVRGILQEIKFQPDSNVTQGTPLFLIEQVEYEAAVQSAKATLGSTEAALKTAVAAVGIADARIASADAAIKVSQAEFDRMESLSGTNAISQSELDAAQANLETAVAAKLGVIAAKVADEAKVTDAQALIEKAKADLKQSELDLERTVVLAPINGRVTRTKVKRGNLVDSGTELVEIVANDPIWANFNISERFLLKLERESRNPEDQQVDLSQVKVQLQRSGDEGFPFEGHLDYFDPKVDQDTATLQLRAIFENPRNQKSGLLPGLFVRVRIQVGQYENALLIPERALSRDQVGAFLYVVDSEKKAVRRNVVVGTKRDEMIVIESGLEKGDSVIVDGLQRVRPGVVVNPG